MPHVISSARAAPFDLSSSSTSSLDAKATAPPAAAPLRKLSPRTRARKYAPDPRDDKDPLAAPPYLRAAAYSKLGETYDARQRSLAALRERADAHPGGEKMHWHRLVDDTFLLPFVRCKKFDVEKAWQEYLAYCTFYDKEGWLVGVDTKLVERLYDEGVWGALSSRDPDGRVIITIACVPLMTILEQYSSRIEDVIKAFFFAIRLDVFHDVHAQVHGVVLVGDLKGYKLRSLSYLSFYQYKQCLHLCQWGIPMRATAFYVQNEPRVVRGIVNGLRTFMKEKVKRSMLCCGSEFALLHSVIPPQSLPPTFGGTLQSSPNDKVARLHAIKELAELSNDPNLADDRGT